MNEIFCQMLLKAFKKAMEEYLLIDSGSNVTTWPEAENRSIELSSRGYRKCFGGKDD